MIVTSIAVPTRRPDRPLDTLPWVKTTLLICAGALFAVTSFALIRLALGLAPPTPWAASVALWVHIGTVMPAIPLGAYVLLTRKGGARHKLLGRIWLSLMFVTAISTIFLRGTNNGQFSWIHLFTLMTLIAVPRAILAARRGDIRSHRNQLLVFYAGSLLIAGLFTFVPGRLMHIWAFG